MWSNQEKRIQKIDHLARSLLIQGLSNDIYSLIDSNKTAKDLWDALARHVLGSEYVINDLKKCGYSKDNCELNFKFLNNLQPKWKQYATMMSQNKNLMDINIDALYNILKQNQGDVNDAMGSKKKIVVVTSNPLALIAEKTKVSKSKEKVVVSSDSEGSEADDFSELKKITTLLAKAFNQRNDSDQEINANMVFMAQIKKVLYDSEASSSPADEKIYELKDLIEMNNDLLAQTKVLKEQLQVKHVVIDTHAECQEKYVKLEAERYEYMIRNSAYFDNDKQHRKQIADQEVLYDKISVQLVELDKHVRDLKNTVLEKDFKIYELKECVRNKDLDLERLNVCENKLHKMGKTNQTVHMIMPSKDNLYNEDAYFQETINLDFEKIDSPFQQTSSLKPYVPNVILEKIIIDLEDEVVNLLKKEKVNLETIESLKSKSFELSKNVSSESENQSENDCLVVEKECDKEENSKVIAPGIFKLNVSQSVSIMSMSKTSCDSKNVEIKLKRKRRKRKSSKQNVKQVDNDVSRANNDLFIFQI
nr:RNA-directed DNA polymerase, eukaryota [Tanacetum cinerariifolium]